MRSINPFNPMTWLVPRPASVSSQSAAKQPIDIRPRSTDAGIGIQSDTNSVTLTGDARGAEIEGKPPFTYESARSVAFTLDIDHVPTTNRSGRTDYTEKNSRIFQVITQQGWSAAECARRLADKVNAKGDFTAKVTSSGESATITFARCG